MSSISEPEMILKLKKFKCHLSQPTWQGTRRRGVSGPSWPGRWWTGWREPPGVKIKYIFLSDPNICSYCFVLYSDLCSASFKNTNIFWSTFMQFCERRHINQNISSMYIDSVGIWEYFNISYSFNILTFDNSPLFGGDQGQSRQWEDQEVLQSLEQMSKP